jgi:hypothetical protein
MSPLYDFRCANGHTHQRLRSYEGRDEPAKCLLCDAPTERLFPLPHVPPDGIYSYAPNIGSAEAFERKEAKIREREEKLAEKGG